MIICRTHKPERIHLRYLFGAPFMAFVAMLVIMLLVIGIGVAETLFFDSHHEIIVISLPFIVVLFAVLFIRIITLSFSHITAYVATDRDGTADTRIFCIYLHNTFLYSPYFKTSRSMKKGFYSVFITAKRMREYADAQKLDTFLSTHDLIGYEINEVLSLKENSKYLIAKVRMNERIVKGRRKRGFSKTLYIPRSFENFDRLESMLRVMNMN